VALFWLMAALLVGNAADEAALQRYRDVRPAMGTAFEIVLYASDEQTAQRAFDAAFQRIDALNQVFSDYDSESEASRLCRQSPMDQAVAISPDMATVLEYSLKLSGKTEGAFDVTVGPLSRLWRRAHRQRKLPDPKRLAEARAAVGYQYIELDTANRRARFTAPGMRLDFGGIAKGYACDEALVALRGLGITRALVNGGGDLALGDPPPDTPGWRIGVAPLSPDDPPSRILHLANCGVATSGDAWQFTEIDGDRYSHILNPLTGLGIESRSSVTVLAPNGMAADALASAVSVLGPKCGVALIETIEGASCLVVALDVEGVKTFVSKEFPESDSAAAASVP
jgi:thiamine biosynthesis lipoprotein